ncbi:hypothetical protein BDU57DRAFT_511419 [Ampelomyces quisqualis]|uniref:Uncharacterized protein n=1 Tax=Ampelomyces quisqualis TaxID=50730 RepID=A0A6A5QSE5_AMPQU|nr:hypothetical protein BDU57DRAFT_511419 [Ampelomyces quisqualis]
MERVQRLINKLGWRYIFFGFWDSWIYIRACSNGRVISSFGAACVFVLSKEYLAVRCGMWWVWARGSWVMFWRDGSLVGDECA